MKVLPEPVAIWMSARGRSSLNDSSRLLMAVIWQSRRPAGLSGGRLVERRRGTRAARATPQRLRAVEGEDLARARLRVAPVGEAGDDAGALVDEGQRLLVVHPFSFAAA